MIKNSAHIRKFTPEQKRQLKAIADTQDIATAKNVLLFTLEQYQAQQNEIARLKRFLEVKRKKIEALQ